MNHQKNASGNCSVSGCPCGGVPHEQPVAVIGTHVNKGGYYEMVVNVPSAEHEPPAPEGEEWRIRNNGYGRPETILDGNREIATVNYRKYAAQIIRDRHLAALVPELEAALKAIAPYCDFVVDRDRSVRCGMVAIAEGSFGLKYCREHKGDREPVDAGVLVEQALNAVAKEREK